MGSDVWNEWFRDENLQFQSTLPAWGATTQSWQMQVKVAISIHAPRMGSDITRQCLGSLPFNFNPRSPHGERPTQISAPFSLLLFQSTLPAWGATRTQTGSDNPIVFQSTLPAWGATKWLAMAYHIDNISIHAPRMGSDEETAEETAEEEISIHAPRMGSDTLVYPIDIQGSLFQSTLPAWGATFGF